MRQALGRGLACLALFLLGLSGSCRLLRHGWPPEAGMKLALLKLANLAAQPARYDTLFIGSSHVSMHIDPALFDATAAAHGQSTCSFNLGVPAMYAPEDGLVCERLFGLPLHGLRRVFLEIQPISPMEPYGTAFNERTIAWHDLRRTHALCRVVWADAEARQTRAEQARAKTVREQSAPGKRRGARRQPWANRWRAVRHLAATAWTAWPVLAPHLQSFTANLTGLGRGAALGAAALESARPVAIAPDAWLGEAGNGFVPVPRATDPEVIAELEQALARHRQETVLVRPLDPPAQENLEAIVAAVRRAGAQPILYLPPNTWGTKFVPARPMNAPILDFTDARRWPALFRIENRQDAGHLDREGAQLLTRYLVEEWLRQP